ncbi:MAG: hypothetical protein V3V10_10090, partial [Planctomycetota bacterium]
FFTRPNLKYFHPSCKSNYQRHTVVADSSTLRRVVGDHRLPVGVVTSSAGPNESNNTAHRKLVVTPDTKQPRT